ncbi:MAG: aspartyl protease family protein [Blastocatellia bacterium]
MPHQLTFAIRETYDTRLEGITIEARLGLGANSVICQAKIDTGGQACLFMREIAETLDIDVETGHRRVFNTLAGSLTGYGHTVTLSTLGLEFDSVVYFATDHNLPRNLLGREGWLQKVRFAVVDYDATLYLSRYQE